MFLILLRFWLRRFVFTFAAALVMLFYWNYTHYGFTENVLINTWGWSLVAAIVTSFISTYLAYLRGKKVLKKAEEKSSAK
ncbi:MAG: hypothetical protein EOO53_10740 [Gammaproteobacteria bacterium]|nr:MAG: hypothetical protein EOO53_10740 [Gammaproteobacteria bacterium]